MKYSSVRQPPRSRPGFRLRSTRATGRSTRATGHSTRATAHYIERYNSATRRPHVPQHPYPVQFRAAGDGRGNPRVGAAIRAQAQRFRAPLESERGGVQSGRRGGVDGGAAIDRLVGDLVSTARSRGGGGEGAGARPRAVCVKRKAREPFTAV